MFAHAVACALSRDHVLVWADCAWETEHTLHSAYVCPNTCGATETVLITSHGISRHRLVLGEPAECLP
jgi:hypothetical protein